MENIEKGITMHFYVTSHYRSRLPNVRSPVYPCVVLSTDTWDDFNYKTFFTVTFYGASNMSGIEIGSVKILEKNQTSGWTPIEKEFDSLNRNFCSLGQTTDYYRELRKLPNRYGATILIALRDMAYNQDIYREFSNVAGISTSLLRFLGAKAALKNGLNIFLDTHQPLEDMDFSFSVKLPKAENSHELHVKFSASAPLPIRMNIMIGRNGTGKTSFLGEFAKSLISSPQAIGRFSKRPLAESVIAVSYNAFDNFDIPDETTSKNMSYFYCGLRGNNSLLFALKYQADDILTLDRACP